MTYAFGAVVHLTTEIRDSGGALVDPSAITVTILQPDGTATSPAAGVKDSTGAYHYDFTPAQAGRHVIRWETTSPTGADEETFDVSPLWSEAGIISLAEAKKHLNIPASKTGDDEELADFIRGATGIVERHVGAVVRRTHSQTFDGAVIALNLAFAPVLSITSVTESGVVVPASGYSLDSPSGVLRRSSGLVPIYWRFGIANVTVVYVVGRAVIEPHWTQAAKIIIGHMWETQRNTSGRRPHLTENAMVSPSTYTVPYRALELLGEPVSGIG